MDIRRCPEGQMGTSRGSYGVIQEVIWGHPVMLWGHPEGHMGSSGKLFWAYPAGDLRASGGLIWITRKFMLGYPGIHLVSSREPVGVIQRDHINVTADLYFRYVIVPLCYKAEKAIR